MFDSIFAFLAGLFGLGSNISGGSKPAVTPTPQIFRTQNLGNDDTPGFTQGACFKPELNVSFTLHANNFQNVSDLRPQLNSGTFPPSQFPATFNTDFSSRTSKDCTGKLMADCAGKAFPEPAGRTYIRVRENLRISSCKTDELAGPHNLFNQLDPYTPQVCTNLQAQTAKTYRGTCEVNGYPDLRKIADIKASDGTVEKEIFWTPFTHNVGCNYSGTNCAVGGDTTQNAGQLLYVLKRRQAFDPELPDECYVSWNESTGHANPCSHFFDVYLAKDIYDQMANVVPGSANPHPQGTPEYKCYQNMYDFYQEMSNCKEEKLFTPVSCTPGLDFPPCYMANPFLSRNFDQATESQIKTNDALVNNYCTFVRFNPNGVDVSRYHLYKLEEFDVTSPHLNWNVCGPLPAGQGAPSTMQSCGAVWTPSGEETYPACFAPIGEITLEDLDQKKRVFVVYGSWTFLSEFFLQEKGSPGGKIYKYIPVENLPPQNSAHSPSLQLTNLQYIAAAQWTWATPICKPAVYLYPEKATDLNVRLSVEGKITVSDPAYDMNTGWNVRAYPDGRIEDGNKAIYPYLYYEADIKGVDIPDEGWVAARSEVPLKVTQIMRKMGFNSGEISDFLGYWTPRLQDRPYYFITLLDESETNEKERIVFSQKPDTLIRARFVFEGLDAPVFVRPIAVTSKERSGFTVTDWGGTLIGSDCGNISVK